MPGLQQGGAVLAVPDELTMHPRRNRNAPPSRPPKRALLFILLWATSLASCGDIARRQTPAFEVLFIGNSLTYVGNTPAVFDALAADNGSTVGSDMIVKGGATLAERVKDGSVARALAAKHYSAVVLQERGGDLMCAFGPDSCVDSRRAIAAIVALARQAGARVYLLGTYQDNPEASRALVAAESAAAVEAGIPYLEISERLQALKSGASGVAWHAPDGMHPGPGLALLNAAVLHQALLGAPPRPAPLEVVAPIYGATSGLTEALRRAEDPPPLPATPRHIEYPAGTVEIVVSALQHGPGR